MIIEVDGGRYEALHKARRSVARQGVKHLVLWDEDCRNQRRYGIGSWPVAYLIGGNGTVLWEGRPSKAALSGRDEQVIIDRRTGLRLRDLVVESLKETSPERIVGK